MKTRGISIDGVGFQTHIGTPNDPPTAAEFAANIERLTDLGLKVVISEMDVNGCDGYTNDQIATIYHDIVATCVASPGCWAVTVWGISDKDSWLNTFSEAGYGGKSAMPCCGTAVIRRRLRTRACSRRCSGSSVSRGSRGFGGEWVGPSALALDQPFMAKPA